MNRNEQGSRWTAAVTVVWIGLLLAVLQPVARGEENLLANPGFEEGLGGWGGDGPGRRAVSAPARSGSRALEIVAGDRWRVSSQQVAVSAGRTYRLSVWLSGERLAPSVIGEGAYAGYELRDASGKLLLNRSIGSLSGTRAYQRVEQTLEIPEGATLLRFKLYTAPGGGTAWFDDARVAPLLPEPAGGAPSARGEENLLANPGFEEGLGVSTLMSSRPVSCLSPGCLRWASNSDFSFTGAPTFPISRST